MTALCFAHTLRTRGDTVRAYTAPRDNPHAPKAERLRKLSIAAYWAAKTPTEAKMAGILLDLYAPDVARGLR